MGCDAQLQAGIQIGRRKSPRIVRGCLMANCLGQKRPGEMSSGNVRGGFPGDGRGLCRGDVREGIPGGCPRRNVQVERPMTCATLVNTQTDTRTAVHRLLAQPAELKVIRSNNHSGFSISIRPVNKAFERWNVGDERFQSCI